LDKATRDENQLTFYIHVAVQQYFSFIILLSNRDNKLSVRVGVVTGSIPGGKGLPKGTTTEQQKSKAYQQVRNLQLHFWILSLA